MLSDTLSSLRRMLGRIPFSSWKRGSLFGAVTDLFKLWSENASFFYSDSSVFFSEKLSSFSSSSSSKLLLFWTPEWLVALHSGLDAGCSLSSLMVLITIGISDKV